MQVDGQAESHVSPLAQLSLLPQAPGILLSSEPALSSLAGCDLIAIWVFDGYVPP